MVNLEEGKYYGENIKAGEDQFFKLSITSYREEVSIEKHYHENSYLSILTAGKYLEKSNGSTHLVNVTDVLFRPNACTHANVFLQQNSTCFNLEFKKGWQELLGLNLALPSNHVHYKMTAFPSLFKLFLNFRGGYDPGLTHELVLEWLFSINRGKRPPCQKSWVAKVENILKHEPGQFHSLNSLADRVHVHPVYLSRAFKEHTGVTISEYQLNAKLQRTVYLLSNSSQRISDISHAGGFFDDAHFIRSFKAAYGIPPLQFRKALKS